MGEGLTFEGLTPKDPLRGCPSKRLAGSSERAGLVLVWPGLVEISKDLTQGHQIVSAALGERTMG